MTHIRRGFPTTYRSLSYETDLQTKLSRDSILGSSSGTPQGPQSQTVQRVLMSPEQEALRDKYLAQKQFSFTVRSEPQDGGRPNKETRCNFWVQLYGNGRFIAWDRTNMIGFRGSWTHSGIQEVSYSNDKAAYVKGLKFTFDNPNHPEMSPEVRELSSRVATGVFSEQYQNIIFCGTPYPPGALCGEDVLRGDIATTNINPLSPDAQENIEEQLGWNLH